VYILLLDLLLAIGFQPNNDI